MEGPRTSWSIHPNGNLPRAQSSRGIPKVSSLTGNRNVLSGKNLDLRYMNISVDDGTDIKLDDGARCIRFLSAAANVEDLLRSPTSIQNRAVKEPVAKPLAVIASPQSDGATVATENQGSTMTNMPNGSAENSKERFKKLLAFFEDGADATSTECCSPKPETNTRRQTNGENSGTISDASPQERSENFQPESIHQENASPSRRIPKVSSLTRDESTFTDGKLDAGHLDISVDDGTEVCLDKGTRSIRFFSAVSNIDAMFGLQGNRKNTSVANRFSRGATSNFSPSSDEESDLRIKNCSQKERVRTNYHSGNSTSKEYLYIEPVTPSNLGLAQKDTFTHGTDQTIAEHFVTKKNGSVPQETSIGVDTIDLKMVDENHAEEETGKANIDVEEMSSPVSPVRRLVESSRKLGKSLRHMTSRRNSLSVSPATDRSSKVFSRKGPTLEEADPDPDAELLGRIFSSNSQMAERSQSSIQKEEACEKRVSKTKIVTDTAASRVEETARPEHAIDTEYEHAPGIKHLLGCFSTPHNSGPSEIVGRHVYRSSASASANAATKASPTSATHRSVDSGEWIQIDASRHAPMMTRETKIMLQQAEVTPGSPQGRSDRTPQKVGRRTSLDEGLQDRIASIRGRMRLYMSRLSD